MKKGFVFVLEMIIALIILFIAFGIFFPGFSYKNKWSDALILSTGRDVILTIDRIGKLYNLSFDFSLLRDFLYSNNVISNATLSWPGTEGTIKNKIRIACNCSEDIIENLTLWLNGLRINDRKIDFEVLYTNLETVNPSDVLLIWGYKDLTNFVNPLESYLKFGNGIVEISDIDHLDNGHKQIFGIEGQGGNAAEIATYDEFRKKPDNSSDIIYGPWKYFYHIPIPLFATQTVGSIPSDGIPIKPCSAITTGNFSIQGDVTGENKGETFSYPFWICDSQYVYFDTDLTRKANIEVQEGSYFYIRDFYDQTKNWTFYINYIDGQEKIGVSFRSEYKFHDFIKVEWGCEGDQHPGNPQRPPAKPIPPGWCQGKKPWAGYNIFLPGTQNWNKILIQANIKTQNNEPIPGVILNGTQTSRVAWISNFTEEGIGDDERLLLISLLLWASNKRAVEIPQALRTVYLAPYVNIFNEDMFEVYEFNLGLGYPY